MSIKRATAFNRIFDPEFLAARKDISPTEMACCQGKLDEVVAGLKEMKDDGSVQAIMKKNRDGNTMLMLAVANGHCQIAQLLLDLKSNVHHRNSQKMDALDYAVLESVRSPMAKVVLSACDYVVTEAMEGPYSVISRKSLLDLHAAEHKLARTTLLGKRPDFSHLFSAETDYRKEWVANFRYIAQLVRKGVLLLHDDIGYLERDALLSGALEIPVGQRYLYNPESKEIKKFTHCLKGPYENAIEARLVETSLNGDAVSVQGLLKARASPHIEDMRGETVLQCACRNGDTQTIRCLLVAKARVNWSNKDGFTALHVATTRANADAVSVLLKAKADLFARSNKGHSVLDFVKHEGHKQILEIVQQERDARKEEKIINKPKGK